MLPPSRASRRAFVMYQRARCSDSVSASHTTWIGWRMRRSNAMVAYSPSNVTVPACEECGVVTWIRSPGLACRDTCRCIFKPPLASRVATLCPFEGYGSSSLLPLRLLADRPGIEIPFQGLERVGPHRLVLRDPLVEFRESLRFQLVDPLLRVHFDIHEPRLAEDLEVAGHGGLCEVPEPGGDIACLPAAGCKKVEDRAARWVRDRKEDVRRHGLSSPELLFKLGEKGFGEALEIGGAEPDLVAPFELQHGLLRGELDSRNGRIRPPWEPVDLQLAPVEQDRIAQDADLVQRVAVLAFDA